MNIESELLFSHPSLVIMAHLGALDTAGGAARMDQGHSGASHAGTVLATGLIIVTLAIKLPPFVGCD